MSNNIVWSIKHNLLCCLKCKTNKKSHYAKGLCIDCYYNRKKKYKKNFVWSKKRHLLRCKNCKTNKNPHYAKGLCKKCYLNTNKSRKRRIKSCKKYYKKIMAIPERREKFKKQISDKYWENLKKYRRMGREYTFKKLYGKNYKIAMKINKIKKQLIKGGKNEKEKESMPSDIGRIHELLLEVIAKSNSERNNSNNYKCSL